MHLRTRIGQSAISAKTTRIEVIWFRSDLKDSHLILELAPCFESIRLNHRMKASQRSLQFALVYCQLRRRHLCSLLRMMRHEPDNLGVAAFTSNCTSAGQLLRNQGGIEPLALQLRKPCLCQLDSLGVAGPYPVHLQGPGRRHDEPPSLELSFCTNCRF